MLEPEAAPKPAQAQLVATARPPGKPPNQACAARNSAVPMPELPAIAPISRNIGIADSSQLAANTNGVSLSALSATLKLRRYQKPRNGDRAHRDADRHAQPDQQQDAGEAEQRERQRAHVGSAADGRARAAMSASTRSTR